MTGAADDRGMVIIGAGECGGRAAVCLRENGWQGAITIIGDELHPPHERPQFSKSFLTSTDEHPPAPNADAMRFDMLAVEHLASRHAVSIDRKARVVVTGDGARIPYHRLLLATGARARPLAVPGGEKAVGLRTSVDAEQIRKGLTSGKRVAIVGGGLIGVEVAASAIATGCKVTVIERQTRILSRSTPPSLAAILEARHRSAGVEFIFGSGVSAIEERDNGVSVCLTRGIPFEVDIVIAGIGAVPNVGLAEEAALDVDNGVTTDEFLRTSDPEIFAAGDCASTIHPIFGNRRLRLESWRSAIEQGGRAASNMLGRAIPQISVPWFWSEQYELTLQVTGFPDTAVTTIDRRLAPDGLLNLHLDRLGTVVAASAVGPLATIAKDIRIAEMLIAREVRPDQTLLSQPGYRLRSLLAA